jgi:hypothetical protein
MSASRRRLRGPSTLPDDPIAMRHQRFIRSLPCLSCGKPAPSECASIGMLPGLGIVPGERYLVPLCGPATVWQDCCHSRKHYRGAVRFWSELEIDPLDLASQLWRVSGDVTAGRRVVARARHAAARQHRMRVDGKGRSPRLALALQNRFRPTAMVNLPTILELPLLLENRS